MNFDFADDPNNPFAQFARMFSGQQADPWQQAKGIAQQIASQNGKEGNVNPLDRNMIDDLSRVAELHLAKIRAIDASGQIQTQSVTRTEWARLSLVTYRPFFERFGEAIGSVKLDVSNEDPLSQMMSQVITSLGPIMVASSAGSMLGHMALETLGQYDLPVPRSNNELLIVPSNLNVLAEAAEAPKEEIYLWVLIREGLMHAIFNIDHIRNSVENLFIDFASAFEPNLDLIENRFGDITSIEDFSHIDQDFQSADSVLSMLRSPSHNLLVPQISAVIAPILGFVDYTMEQLTFGLISKAPEIAAAVSSRRSEENEADRFMAQLLGLDLLGNLAKTGKQFVEGIADRAGENGLKRLWQDELDLPTVAEIQAPGLWLERIGLAEGFSEMFAVPDDISELIEFDQNDDQDSPDEKNGSEE